MRSLIIDDDFISRQVMHAALGNLGPCEEAASGLEGVRLFTDGLRAKRPYDLVVTDVLMAGMDGHQTINALRQAEKADAQRCRTSPTPVMVITTLRQFADMQRLQQTAGPVAFVAKPLDRSELRLALSRLGLA